MFIILWKANKKRRIKFSGCLNHFYFYYYFYMCVEKGVLAANQGHLNTNK